MRRNPSPSPDSHGAPAARRSGFTLIELLVVLAIIAIMTAASLPMIPAMNDQARIGTCESRLQQVGVALRLYAEDYHRFPASLEALYKGGYVEQHALLQCGKTGGGFFYRPAALAADRATLIAACVDPATPRGRRPHRHGTVLVELRVHGGTTLAR